MAYTTYVEQWGHDKIRCATVALARHPGYSNKPIQSHLGSGAHLPLAACRSFQGRAGTAEASAAHGGCFAKAHALPCLSEHHNGAALAICGRTPSRLRVYALSAPRGLARRLFAEALWRRSHGVCAGIADTVIVVCRSASNDKLKRDGVPHP